MATHGRDGSSWTPVADSHSYLDSQSHQTATHPVEIPNHQSRRHQCLSVGCAISRVFATTELHELILSFLTTDHILPLRLTAKGWNQIILTSPCLRLHLFVRPRWRHDPTDFELVPFCTPGLEFKRGELVHMGQWVTVTMTLDAARRISPPGRPALRRRSRSVFESLCIGVCAEDAVSQTTGSEPNEPEIQPLSTEGLYISQPPITCIQAVGHHRMEVATPSDSSESNFNEGEMMDLETDEIPYAKLSCHTGITLGFLAETAQMILEKRQDSQTITYRTIISFAKYEPRRDKRSSSQRVDIME
ncbi:hypothetical protein K431DRAFT_231778 [Polychaeton citri CBS 116435]|uniref:F-box domain-containing protein n=1 Tax=Polychaeton citri CBS 116435 TaxID=1314669 RepID=A0A9P4Q445_9PEZI|nr:hypothetical protein K431DRAFT_231778 [Polychaeton citri CBS 116435]